LVGPSPGVVLFAAVAVQVAVVAPAAITIGLVHVVDAYKPVTVGSVRFTDNPPAGAAMLDVTVNVFDEPLSGTEPAGAAIETLGTAATAAGHVIVAVSGVGLPAGLDVCAQLNVAV
jgi:hypothetical protein